MIAHPSFLTSERGRERGRVDKTLQQKSLYLCSDIGTMVVKILSVSLAHIQCVFILL